MLARPDQEEDQGQRKRNLKVQAQVEDLILLSRMS